jgi:hypothetical protein
MNAYPYICVVVMNFKFLHIKAWKLVETEKGVDSARGAPLYHAYLLNFSGMYVHGFVPRASKLRFFFNFKGGYRVTRKGFFLWRFRVIGSSYRDGFELQGTEEN